MGNAIYCGLCISESADKAKHGPNLSREKELGDSDWQN